MTTQSKLQKWIESNDGETDTNGDGDNQEESHKTNDNEISEQLIENIRLFRQERLRPIPSSEQYPAWKMRLRNHGISPKTLAEEDYVGGRHYTNDDREEPTYKEHFVEIHKRTNPQ